MSSSVINQRGLAGCLVTLVLLGVWVAPALGDAPQQAQPPNEALRYADALSQAFEYAAETIRPSVVAIHSVKHLQPQGRSDGRQMPLPQLPEGFPFDDDLLRRFFGDHVPQVPEIQEGLGSGVIVSADGYVLTNNHVVGEADEVTVMLGENRELRAEVVGTDPMTDLAVIRIKADKLPAAKLGNSDKLKVGEWVVAAGNPFGLSDTITAGIVSAKGRANMRIAEYEDYIQTDAAINPGNSGGPLVNLRGEVVGINTAIASRTGVYNGVGFTIPINLARSIMDSLIKTGQVVRGWLGVSVQQLDEGMAKTFGYDSTNGVLIGDVLRGGPAEKAGLHAGDIVTALDGTKITEMNQFRNLIAAKQPGSSAKMEVYRNGKTTTVTVEIGRRTPEMAAAPGRDISGELGMTVANLTPDLARSFGLSSSIQGVLVTEVAPAGMAARSGIVVGNVILEVQGVPVSNVTEFHAQLGKHDLKAGVRLLVQAGEGRHFVLLRNPE
ncbi:MAG TPA: DegQ family serine endoprotease [Phycisphaerae bacterium]|nr:DegQ family serine endoprotease [Phycisphaerae bacterium]